MRNSARGSTGHLEPERGSLIEARPAHVERVAVGYVEVWLDVITHTGCID